MIEFLGGLVKFDIFVFTLNVILIALFTYSVVKKYRETGVVIDYWNYFMFFNYFVPFLIMYPFVCSYFSAIAIGIHNQEVVEKYSYEAYFVSLLGYMSIYLGRFYLEYFKTQPVIDYLLLVLNSTTGKFFRKVVDNTKTIRIFCFLYLMALIVFQLYLIKTGNFSDPRGYFMINNTFRPIYNFIISCFSFVYFFMLVRVLQYNHTIDKALILPLSLCGLFLGARAPLFSQLQSGLLLFIIYKKQGNVDIKKLILILVVGLCGIVGISTFRKMGRMDSASFSVVVFTSTFEIFYGNTFSDLRDFSWLLGYWDHTYYWGRSYLAGAMSFIPSSLSNFREQWNIGRLTVSLIGHDPSVHPGVRPGMFGEMYLNFGFIGVMFMGFLFGYINRKIHNIFVKSAPNYDIIYGSSIMMAYSVISYLSISAGIFGFYVQFVLLFILYLISRVRIVT